MMLCKNSGCIKKARYGEWCLYHLKQNKSLILEPEEILIIIEALEELRNKNLNNLSSSEDLSKFELERNRIVPVYLKIKNHLEAINIDLIIEKEKKHKEINELTRIETYTLRSEKAVNEL